MKELTDKEQLQKINQEALMDYYQELEQTAPTKKHLWHQFYERKQEQYLQLTGERYEK